jgi:hypothetical protein
MPEWQLVIEIPPDPAYVGTCRKLLSLPELVLNTECFGVEVAKVRHQLVFERFEGAGKSWALGLRLRRNDLLVSRRRQSQRWQSLKQSHEILFTPG